MSTPAADIDPHAPEYETPVADDPMEGAEEGGDFMAGLFDAASGIDAESEPEVDIDTPEEPETPAEETETPAEDTETPDEEKEIDPATDPDFVDAPDIKSKVNKIGWKELKQRKASAERERDAAKAELERLRKAPATPANSEEATRLKAELEDHKKQLADYDQRVALLDVEQSREYRANIAEPLARAEELIQSFAKKYDIAVADIAKAATEPSVLDRNQLLSDLVSGMNDFDKFEFKKVVDDARSLYERSVQVKANAKQSLKFVEETRAKEAAERKQRQSQELNKTADQVWSGLTDRMPFLKEDKALASRLDADARGADLAGAPIDTQVYARYAAVALPTLLEKYEAITKELATMKSSLAKRRAVSPAARSGSIATTTEKDGDDFMGGLDAILGTAGRGL